MRETHALGIMHEPWVAEFWTEKQSEDECGGGVGRGCPQPAGPGPSYSSRRRGGDTAALPGTARAWR
jgi:hypothetical protein